MVELQPISMSSTPSNTSNDGSITTTTTSASSSSSSSSSDHSTSPTSPQPPTSLVVATSTTFYPQLIYYYCCYYNLPHLYVYPYPSPPTTFYLRPPSDAVFIQPPPQVSNKPRRKPKKKSNNRLRSFNDHSHNNRDFNVLRKPKAMSMSKDKQIKMDENGGFPHPPPYSGVECTSVMIKNIPNSVSRRTLIGMLDTHCRNENRGKYTCACGYDLVYLPFDFKHEQNLGYAFVNFTSVEAATMLRASWNGKGWEDSCKIREIASAKFQGIKKLRNHFRGSTFRCVSEEYLPVEFWPPRNGFNSHLCKGFNIGTWVPPASVDMWEVATVIPPRLSHQLFSLSLHHMNDYGYDYDYDY